mmetsp:Transcript_62353/g.124937  ORF Transcript_62353/g.124937 Transcript_62353/m.124937 type:complete len:155 (-) Transcript_62353:270-734(-)|eukprot:CAMPEP_0171607360 /NCGR_PEP_ID=MMETSP0990-20121206/8289_1 /TAXON_ID=483369 /ORGANISM="non described non described, Strain CCMP2098" /LENGTH=154 /DNA_ID=CAMNT_0012170327 /DNA_START=513 /DNA_END=977 /DNA_ORIENTATION=+
MKKRTSSNTKKGVVYDDDDDYDDDAPDCLACMGRHRPHTCTLTRESRKKQKAAKKLQAESSVSEPPLQSRTRETYLCGSTLVLSSTGGLIVDRPPEVIHVHPTLTTEAAEAAIAAVPPALAPATVADSTTSQRLMNLLWDDLLVLPLESSLESN